MNKLQIYTHPSAFDHDTGPNHPECVERIGAVMSLFVDRPFNVLPMIEAREATTAEIMRAHPVSHIQNLQDKLPSGDKGDEYGHADYETVMSPQSLEAANHAAGAVCHAVDDIIRGDTERAFCAMRPPGHHAEPTKPMGFCLYNNIFIGARHAQAAHNIAKIAIIDFDVHHGNGTDVMTRNAEDIFYISSHQSPLYPNTGFERDNIDGKIMNIEFAANTSSQEFRTTYEQRIFPALHDFKPELLMISAGFDAHRDDPIGGMDLAEDDFEWVTAELAKIANLYCNARIVSVLEGGYNLTALAHSTAAHLRGLMAD